MCYVPASCIWDLESGKKTTDIDKAHAGDVVSMSLSPDKNTFITGSVDRTCKLWDLRDNTCKQIFFGHQADVNSVCVSYGANQKSSNCKVHIQYMFIHFCTVEV